MRISQAGVQVMFGEDQAGRLCSTDGAILAEADLIVTAVGDLPNTEWLLDSGLALAGGVVVDNECRVLPDIVAAGDVISIPTIDGRRIRSPHWWNALTQATIAAATLLGREPQTRLGTNPSFFWTEMFGLRIRIAGQLPPLGEPTVVDGSLEDRRTLLV